MIRASDHPVKAAAKQPRQSTRQPDCQANGALAPQGTSRGQPACGRPDSRTLMWRSAASMWKHRIPPGRPKPTVSMTAFTEGRKSRQVPGHAGGINECNSKAAAAGEDTERPEGKNNRDPRR